MFLHFNTITLPNPFVEHLEARYERDQAFTASSRHKKCDLSLDPVSVKSRFQSKPRPDPDRDTDQKSFDPSSILTQRENFGSETIIHRISILVCI